MGRWEGADTRFTREARLEKDAMRSVGDIYTVRINKSINRYIYGVNK